MPRASRHVTPPEIKSNTTTWMIQTCYNKSVSYNEHCLFNSKINTIHAFLEQTPSHPLMAIQHNIYKGVQRYTGLYKGIQEYTKVYKGIQGYYWGN